MLGILLKLLDEPGQVGEDAPGVLAHLVSNNEELQRSAAEQKVVEKLANFLLREEVPTKQLEGVLLALTELCSRLEDSRRNLLDLQVQGPIVAALCHPCEGVKVAACACVKSLSRSVKNLRTYLATEQFVRPLLQLLNDSSQLVQVEALTAFGNIVLDFNPHKIVVMQFGGFIQLVNLAQSMEPALRRNAVLALKNLLYMADITVKRRVMSELSVSTLCDLIRDAEEDVQEQAISLVQNLVYGDPDSVEQIFADESLLLQAVEKQLVTSRPEISLQALRVINNVAAGSELHKEAVMALVLPQQSLNYSLQTPWLIRFLQEMSNPQLRVVAVLCIINLTYPGENGTSSRVLRLREAGVESQLQRMVDDPCLDVKDRVMTALEHFKNNGLQANIGINT